MRRIQSRLVEATLLESDRQNLHRQGMKLRHAAALALVGWYLTIGFGKTYEKGCLSCGVDLGQGFGFGGPPFATKAKCEQAGNKEVRAFYAEAKKNGERVAFPTTFKCVEKHDSKPATPLLKLGH